MTGVYLAYPIDQAGSSGHIGASVGIIREWLSSRASWVFDPGAAFTVSGPPSSSSVREINREALHRAGVVVALLPSGVPSVGVPMEIERAVAAGKHVLVISDAPSWMLVFEPEAGSRVRVSNTWGDETQAWLSEALRVASESPGGPDRAPLPVKISGDGEMPSRGYDDDAGLDLVVSETTVITPGAFVDVPCSVAVELPDWSWGLITGRSSTLRRRGLLVNQGVIDAGYRGPLFAGVWNLGKDEVWVKQGERIAQLIIMINGTRQVEPVRVQDLLEGSRGSAGFGSTGL